MAYVSSIPDYIAEYARRGRPVDPAAEMDVPASVAAPSQPDPAMASNPMQAAMQGALQAFSPQALSEAQRADVSELRNHQLSSQFANAASLISGHDVKPYEAMPAGMNTGMFGQRQELAGKNMQMVGSMMQMDPNSAPSVIARNAAKSMGLPVGDNWGAYHVGLLTDALAKGQGISKTSAEISKTLADTGKTGVETQNLKLGQPGILSANEKTRAEVGETKARTGQIQTETGLARPKFELEQHKVAVEEKRYRSEHPDEPVPGYSWDGPAGTAAPSRDSAEVQSLGDKVAAAGEMKTILGEMKDIYDKSSVSGRVVGGDATRLDQLHEKLLGTIGRAASGGKLAAYDITLAHDQLPRPSNITGAFRTDKIHAAIDQLTKDADVGHREWAKAHNFKAKAAAAAALSPRDAEAAAWAKANPNDPRAAKILQRVGGQ